jgi:hypothetical protein
MRVARMVGAIKETRTLALLCSRAKHLAASASYKEELAPQDGASRGLFLIKKAF